MSLMYDCSERGTFRVWPLCCLWSTDRDQTTDISGVHRAYQGEYGGWGGEKALMGKPLWGQCDRQSYATQSYRLMLLSHMPLI